MSLRSKVPVDVFQEAGVRMLLLLSHEGRMALANQSSDEKKVMWAPPHEMVRSQETLGQAMTRILFLVCGLAPNQIDQYSTLVLGKCNKDISDVAGRKVWPFFVFARVTNLTPTKADLSWMQKDHDFCLSIGSPSFRGATFEALSAVRRRQIMPPQFFT